MRLAHAPWVIGLSIACSGCALIEDGAHNAYVGMKNAVEAHQETRRNRQWADVAWQQACAALQPAQRNEDFAAGFKAGYAEYLYRGGNGEPPLLAPQKYRQMRYQTPEGYQAADNWFSGYRYGAGVARDTGARKWITGPTALSSELHQIEVEEAIARQGEPTPLEPKEFIIPPPQKVEPSVPAPMPIPMPKRSEVPRSLPGAPLEIAPPAFPATPATQMVPPPEPVRPAFPATPATQMAPPPQPARARIIGVSDVPTDPMRARIMNIAGPENEPVRVRINAIKAVPNPE